MKNFLVFLLLLLGACEPALESSQFGDDDPMARRVNENKNVSTHGKELQPVAVVVPSHGWWSGSGNVGTEVPFAPDTQNRQTILSLPEIGAPEIWTVSLYLTQAVADFKDFDVTGRVEFGAGGSTQIVELDWMNGAQISVPCNAINVIAEYQNIDVTTAGSGIRLGVQVSRGRRGGNQTPRMTMLENVVIPANSVFPVLIPIPAFASKIHVLPTTISSAAVLYSATTHLATFSGNGAGAFNTGLVNGDNLLQTDGIPVSASARFVKFTNLDPVNDIHFSMYADLFG